MFGVLAALAIARGVIFMMPGVRFDADQAVVGLMAKHISEGRAFPVYFYGQSYLLAVEAYLAAPVMWLLGPTEVALKLPLVAMNVGAALLLAAIAHRDLGLRPWLAGVCALPLALPPIVVGTRLMEAMGGNAELPLYALLLWVVRARPWTFAVVAAAAFSHRELVAYCIVALLALEAIRGVLWTPAALQRWTLALVALAAARAAIDAVRPFGAMFGPGTVARAGNFDISSSGAIGTQLCADPSRWASRFEILTSNHLPLLVGGAPGWLNNAGVGTWIEQGHLGLGPWVLGMATAGLIAGGWRRWREAPPTSTGGSIPKEDFGWYLMLVGTVSILVYWLVACSQIVMESFRYDLLAFLLPIGALLVGVHRASPPVTAGLVTAALLWFGIGAIDYAELAAEIRAGRWPDYRGQAVVALEARGLTVLSGEYRIAHLLSFRSQERVIVNALERERIDLYAERAQAAGGPVLTMAACPGGETLVPTIYLCPRP